MRRKDRVKRLEKKLIKTDKYRVVMPQMGLFFSNCSKVAYWTDEEPMSLLEWYQGRRYKKVKHPVYGYEVPKGMV